MMRISSGKCSLCAMQPSLMDNDKMGGSPGKHNNQTAAMEMTVLGSAVHTEGRWMMACAWEKGGGG